MLDSGFKNDEGYLEIVTKGTGGVRNGLRISRKCGDGGPVPLGHSTST